MDTDLEQGEASTLETQASAVQPEPEEAGQAEAPVVLADAMCGAFCSIKGETRLA